MFTLGGEMQGPRGFIDSASATRDLPLGPATIPLRFDGHAIRLSGSDASFLVRLSLRDRAGTEVDNGLYVTSPYRTSDFQPPDSIAPTSVATVSGGYGGNGPVRVSLAATDPAPSAGRAPAEPYSRCRATNTSCSPSPLL